jgi:hypothetical protein
VLQDYGKIADHPSTFPFHTSGEHGNGVLCPHSPFRAETRPDVIAQLEWLDDLMFAAIDGDPVALEAAALAWHKTVDEKLPRNRATSICAALKVSGVDSVASPINPRTKSWRPSK